MALKTLSPSMRCLTGLIAGAAATAPMTVVMTAGFHLLPEHEQYPLPPREITEKLASEAGVRKEMDEKTTFATTVVAHFGYGAACGLIYAWLPRPREVPPAVQGMSFGLVVWLGSYLGLLPAMRILKPATQHPAERNWLMIVAHLVWGATTGWLIGVLSRKGCCGLR